MEFNFSQCNFPQDCKHYASWGDFVTWVKANKDATNDGICNRVKYSHTTSESESWDLNTNLTAAIQLAETGWIDGMKEADKVALPMIEKLSGRIQKQDIQYDYEGHDIDVGRFVIQDPECWIRMEDTDELMETYNKPKFITLTHNVTASAMVNAEEAIRKGAHVMALIQCLEFAGYRAEVHVYLQCTAGMRRGGVNSATVCTVKTFDMPLDPALLIYQLAHPAVLRRLGFVCIENLSTKAQSDLGSGYGMPGNLQTDANINIPSNVGSIDFEWIIKQLQNQGIKLA